MLPVISARSVSASLRDGEQECSALSKVGLIFSRPGVQFHAQVPEPQSCKWDSILAQYRTNVLQTCLRKKKKLRTLFAEIPTNCVRSCYTSCCCLLLARRPQMHSGTGRVIMLLWLQMAGEADAQTPECVLNLNLSQKYMSSESLQDYYLSLSNCMLQHRCISKPH